MNVVRIVVDGWTWVRGEADNTERARRMLTDALGEDGWPLVRATVTITPGGFVRIPFPREYDREGGARGWGSDADFWRLIPVADEAVHRVVALKTVMARLRSRTRLLTIGVDLNSTLLKGGPKTHSEMVAVVDTDAGRVVHWTSKSYPADAVQERTLVHAPLESHLFTLRGHRMLILGCHDLNMFSARAWANQDPHGIRRRRCNGMRRVARRFEPTAVLHHPHTTDSPRVWSTAWAGVRQILPSADALASAIAYCGGDEEGNPRGRLVDVRERTALGSRVTDIVVEGH